MIVYKKLKFWAYYIIMKTTLHFCLLLCNIRLILEDIYTFIKWHKNQSLNRAMLGINLPRYFIIHVYSLGRYFHKLLESLLCLTSINLPQYTIHNILMSSYHNKSLTDRCYLNCIVMCKYCLYCIFCKDDRQRCYH